MARRALLALVGLALVTPVLSGCGDEPHKPSPLDAASASATPTPSTSPSPTPPAMPEEAKGTSDEAAIAFVEHWIDTLNYATATLDTAPLKALSADDCRACATTVRRLGAVADHGGSLQSTGWKVLNASVINDSRPGVIVQTYILIPPQVARIAANAKPQTFKGGKAFYSFTIIPRQGNWTVTDLVDET